jgi:hypothetical protein
MTGAVRAAEAAQQSHDTGDIRGAVAHVTSIKSAMGSIRTAMSTSPDPNGVLANHAGKAEQSVANFLDVLTPAKVGTNNQRGAARRFGVSVNPSFMASSKILRENHVKKLQNARNRKPTNG